MSMNGPFQVMLLRMHPVNGGFHNAGKLAILMM
jgi:hypothetical protein